MCGPFQKHGGAAAPLLLTPVIDALQTYVARQSVVNFEYHKWGDYKDRVHSETCRVHLGVIKMSTGNPEYSLCNVHVEQSFWLGSTFYDWASIEQ